MAAVFPILLGVVGSVLLIACSNVAHLMLAKGVMRRQEIGMRLALVAGRGRILRQMLTESLLQAGLRRGFCITLLGTTVGMASAAALHRVLASFLVGVSPLDPGVYAGVAVALMGTALLACYFPARRAAAMDPASALRRE